MFVLVASTARAVVVDRRRDHRLDERRRRWPAPSSTSIGAVQADDAAERGERDRPRARGRRRRPRSAPVAAPHGLVCLMTAAAGSLNSRTMRAAASRSSRFVYDSSLPCSTVAAPRPARRLPRRTTPPADAGSRRSGGRAPCAAASVSDARAAAGAPRAKPSPSGVTAASVEAIAVS